MCVCVCVCNMYICIYVHIFVYIHTYTYLYTYIHTFIYIHTHTTHTHTHIHEYMDGTEGRLRWLDSSAAAQIKDSIGDIEIKAAAHRLDAYLAFGHTSLNVLRRKESVRRTRDPAPRPR